MGEFRRPGKRHPIRKSGPTWEAGAGHGPWLVGRLPRATGIAAAIRQIIFSKMPLN
jgi:hypothetical protein